MLYTFPTTSTGQLLNEMNLPTTVHIDNQSAICLAKNPAQHKRTKHIAVKHYLLRELVERQEIKVVYLNTKEQIADTLTKCLPKSQFEKHRTNLGVMDVLEITRE